MKEYHYVNDYGYNKKLLIDEEEEEMPFSIWSMDTGDFCGAGTMTREQLNDFLQHYGITG